MKDEREMGMTPQEEIKRIENRTKGNWSKNFNWYQMLPKEDGKKANNRLYFGLFRPSLFTGFGECIPEKLYTYYFKLPLHYLYDPIEGRDMPIICTDGVNEVVKTSVPGATGVPYPNEKCKYCSMEQGWWKRANERREALGGKQVPYETLQKDEE